MSEKTPNNKEKKVKKADTKLNNEDKEILKKAMISALQENLDDRKTGIRKDLSVLSTTVEEFLTTFIILGYTFDGEPVHCISAHNQQEADALVTLMNKFFHTHIDDEHTEQD